jgi:hypothetical protein
LEAEQKSLQRKEPVVFYTLTDIEQRKIVEGIVKDLMEQLEANVTTTAPVGGLGAVEEDIVVEDRTADPLDEEVVVE